MDVTVFNGSGVGIMGVIVGNSTDVTPGGTIVGLIFVSPSMGVQLHKAITIIKIKSKHLFIFRFASLIHSLPDNSNSKWAIYPEVFHIIAGLVQKR